MADLDGAPGAALMKGAHFCCSKSDNFHTKSGARAAFQRRKGKKKRKESNPTILIDSPLGEGGEVMQLHAGGG